METMKMETKTTNDKHSIMKQDSSFNRNPELWELARRRAGFKSHLFTYVIMIPFFWLIWFLAGQHLGDSGLPWPIWPTAGWGIGIVFHFLGVHVFHKYNLVEREYEKILQERK